MDAGRHSHLNGWKIKQKRQDDFACLLPCPVPFDRAKRCHGAAETPSGMKHETRSDGVRSSEYTHRCVAICEAVYETDQQRGPTKANGVKRRLCRVAPP